MKALLRKDLPKANIVETNTYYESDRYILIDLDNGGKHITTAEAVNGLVI